MYCIVIHVISASRWFVWEVLIQYYVHCVERRTISERAGKQFASTRAKTAFVGAGVSVEFCFTLRARSMNRFCLTGFIVALAIRELLSASAIKVFTIMICAHGCVSYSPSQSHVCWRLLSMICRHKRCRPVWAQCCNTIDSSLLTRARKSPGTIIGSGEDWGFRPQHPRHKQKHQ